MIPCLFCLFRVYSFAAATITKVRFRPLNRSPTLPKIVRATHKVSDKMGNILEEIAAQRRLDVEAAKRVVPAEQLVKKIESSEAVYGSALRVLDRLNAPVVRR